MKGTDMISKVVKEYNDLHLETDFDLYEEYDELLGREGLGSPTVFNFVTNKIKEEPQNPNHYIHLMEVYLWKKDFDKVFETMDILKLHFPVIEDREIEEWKNEIEKRKPALIKKEMKIWHINECAILFMD